jgi:hypothetical protein
MINLSPILDRIAALLAEDTDASVTYAALEARLALEKVCYDRLRQCHDYISHAQLRRWQPRRIMNTLLKEVDQHATQTFTLHISKNPARPDVKPEHDEYAEIGTQVGFDPKYVEKLWNALAKLALHARLPEHKEDHISAYGDKVQIRAKVEEVVRELERLSKGNMTFSGVPVGGDITFVCTCGEKNRRRAALLREGQRIFCINPDCDASFTVRKEGSEIGFEAETCDFTCQGCGDQKSLPWRFFFEKLKFGDRAVFDCRNCSHRNYVEWRLTQVAPASPPPNLAAA